MVKENEVIKIDYFSNGFINILKRYFEVIFTNDEIIYSYGKVYITLKDNIISIDNSNDNDLSFYDYSLNSEEYLIKILKDKDPLKPINYHNLCTYIVYNNSIFNCKTYDNFEDIEYPKLIIVEKFDKNNVLNNLNKIKYDFNLNDFACIQKNILKESQIGFYNIFSNNIVSSCPEHLKILVMNHSRNTMHSSINDFINHPEETIKNDFEHYFRSAIDFFKSIELNDIKLLNENNIDYAKLYEKYEKYEISREYVYNELEEYCNIYKELIVYNRNNCNISYSKEFKKIIGNIFGVVLEGVPENIIQEDTIKMKVQDRYYKYSEYHNMLEEGIKLELEILSDKINTSINKFNKNYSETNFIKYVYDEILKELKKVTDEKN